MGLINDVLTQKNARPSDNDKRTTDSSETPLAIEDIAQETYRKIQKRKRLIISVLVAIVAIILIMLVVKEFILTTGGASSASATASVATQPEKLKIATIPAVTPSKITAVTTNEKNGVTSIVFALNKAVKFATSRVHDNNTNILYLQIQKAELTGTLPVIKQNNAISAIDKIASMEQGQIDIAIHLKPGAHLSGVRQSTTFGKGEQIAIEIQAPKAPATHNPVIAATGAGFNIRKLLPYNQEQNLESIFHSAVSLAQQGDYPKAIRKLKLILMISPGDSAATQSLANIYIKQGNLLSAEQLLINVTLQNPRNVPLNQLLSQVQLLRGNAQLALETLSRLTPNINQTPDYYTLMASIYIKMSKPMLAAGIYQRLLTINSTNPQWWMGLGVALQDAGRYHMSVQAYKKALNTNSLNPQVAAFIQTQLDARQ